MDKTVSILMLTHNAPRYVRKTLVSLKKHTRNVKYELIVVDNGSRSITRKLLEYYKRKGFIDKLELSKDNLLFAKGNNKAFEFAENNDYILLLNSDIKIKSDSWLKSLMEIHPKNGGISAFGACDSEPIRADGYCMLINRELYEKYKLDEEYEWFWSVTKLESKVLKEGKSIVAIKNHENFIHHYGGKSGGDFKNAKGMDVDRKEVIKWFEENNIKVLENLS